MKRKQIYLLFFSSLFSLIMAGCCDVPPQDYYFSNYTNVNAFKVRDVYNATFKGNKGATHVFDNIVYKDELIANSDCSECCDKFQTLKVVYDGENVSFNLNFVITYNSASAGDGLSVFYNSKYKLNLLYYNEIFSYMENESLSRVIVGKNAYSELLDSVRLNESVFYNVYKFKKELSNSKLYPKELFYTKEQGVVGYVMSDSTVYNLEN